MTKRKTTFGNYPSAELSPRQVERTVRRFKRKIKDLTRNGGTESEFFQLVKALFEKLDVMDGSIEAIGMQINRWINRQP